jgi:cyclophilin family peptidyl-prolyl cis-trans isomerase
MSTLRITTSLGTINMRLLPSSAPITSSHISNLVTSGLFNNNGITFYRSDFVIQTGLYGTRVNNPHPDLPVNETSLHSLESNTRGTVAVAHHDVPDNGNSEFFINLSSNTHLDEAYGGYCVFARVEDGDSFDVVDSIAEAVKSEGSVDVEKMEIV